MAEALPPVAITGVGVLTALGASVDTLWSAMIAGKCASRHWDDLAQGGYRVTHASRIAAFAAPPLGRGAAMAVAAAVAAASDAVMPPGRLGIFVGSTMGESAKFEAAAETGVRWSGDATAAAFGRAIDAAIGPSETVRVYSTACAAGNSAIAAAVEQLRRGAIDVAVAGGVDAFSRTAMVGFTRSRAMTPDLCRPFDAERQGMQLAEGAAFMVLERMDDAQARNATIIAKAHGAGFSCDAHHPTAPRADGSGMARAMRGALRLAGVTPNEVGLVCAHGSGTRTSDAAEARAIFDVFGGSPVVAGYKGALGHAMGAAAAIEAIIVALALARRVIPPTVNTRRLDPDMRIDVALAPRPLPDRRFALSNAFGFGGINSALLLEAA